MTAEFIYALQITCFVVGVIGFVQVIVQLLNTYECTRFFRKRIKVGISGVYTPRVQLTLPCKGVDPRFDDQVRAILNLDYPEYHVVFVVESIHDAAHSRLKELISEQSLSNSKIVVAGESRNCGQKVHNLLVATAERSGEIEVYAFADSDAVMDAQWLRRLVYPLREASRGIVTGNRWFTPEGDRWAPSVLTAMNAGLVMLAGNHSRNLVWGGSWACRREIFEAVIKDGAWSGSVSDDLPLRKVLKKLHLRAVFEPSCLVASPANCTWSEMAEFGRRQYLITRVYAPAYWWLAISMHGLSQIAFWGSIIALIGFPLGAAKPWVIAFLLTIYGINTVRAVMRQKAAELRFPARTPAAKRAKWLDIIGHPLLGLGHTLLLITSLGREITWRGIRYRLHNANRTEIISRSQA